MIRLSPSKTWVKVLFLRPKALNYAETPSYQLYCETHIKLSSADSTKKTVKENQNGR